MTFVHQNGLLSSRWASGSYKNDYNGTTAPVYHGSLTPPISTSHPQISEIPPNDWICPICNNKNFQKLTACFQCTYQYSGPVMAVSGLSNITNRASKTTPQNPDSTKKTTVPPLPAKFKAELKSGNRGLASSRFASKPYTNLLDAPPPYRESQSTTYPPKRYVSFTSDHALPFDVQNHILLLLVQLLETILYRFTSRYLPSLMSAHPSWTCPQVIELSKWRTVLSTHKFSSTAPSWMHTYKGKQELNMALKDAVRIRNLAVHRASVANGELKALASKAGLLCTLLGDEPGTMKCDYLVMGIEQWEVEGEKGMIGWDQRKASLEFVLKTAGDGEVDEMDWSVVEVPPNGGPEAFVLGVSKVPEKLNYYPGLMDID